MAEEVCCPPSQNRARTHLLTLLQFGWNKSQQGTILGAFFFGYIITQMPARMPPLHSVSVCLSVCLEMTYRQDILSNEKEESSCCRLACLASLFLLF